MTEKGRDKLYNAIIACTITIIGAAFSVSYASNVAENNEFKNDLKKKANITYVDKENDDQDENLKIMLRERDKVNEIILEELKYIRNRVDKIPTR